MSPPPPLNLLRNIRKSSIFLFSQKKYLTSQIYSLIHTFAKSYNGHIWTLVRVLDCDFCTLKINITVYYVSFKLDLFHV